MPGARGQVRRHVESAVLRSTISRVSNKLGSQFGVFRAQDRVVTRLRHGAISLRVREMGFLLDGGLERPPSRLATLAKPALIGAEGRCIPQPRPSMSTGGRQSTSTGLPFFGSLSCLPACLLACLHCPRHFGRITRPDCAPSCDVRGIELAGKPWSKMPKEEKHGEIQKKRG